MLETNVHYPTDCNLLWDAARKSIELLFSLCLSLGLPGWRKAGQWKAKIKSAVRECERTASGGGANKAERTVESAQKLLAIAYDIEAKVHASMKTLEDCALSPIQAVKWLEIDYYHDMLIKHIDLIERRLIQGETIPHEEKVFSLFEPHTELIKKGKQMPPVEFGHRLLICTDQNELILDYRIMEGGSEVDEIIPLADRLLNRYGEENIASLSTDRGFSSRENRELLQLYIPTVVMPKKGKLSAEDIERQSQRHWSKLQDHHSAVESDINCLEHHGLNRCPDKRLRGYKRYAGLGVLAYNLHKIGAQLLKT